MVKEEYQNILLKELSEKPLVSSTTLSRLVPYTTEEIRRYIQNQAQSGNRYAKIWVKTTPMRIRWKTFYNALCLYKFARKNNKGVEEIEQMDPGLILCILELTPTTPHRKKKLERIQEYAIKLMNIFNGIGLTDEQIDYAIGFYGKRMNKNKSDSIGFNPTITNQIYVDVDK